MEFTIKAKNSVSGLMDISIHEVHSNEGEVRGIIYGRFTDPQKAGYHGLFIDNTEGSVLPYGRQMRMDIPEDMRDPEDMREILSSHKVDHLNFSMAVGIVQAATQLRVTVPNVEEGLNDFNKLLKLQGMKEIGSDEVGDTLFISDAKKSILTGTPFLSSPSHDQLYLLNIPIQTDKSLSGFEVYNIVKAMDEFPAVKNIDIALAGEALKTSATKTSTAVSYYGQTNHPKHEIRLQAAQAYPLLAGLIADTAALRGTVDRMEPLQPVLEKMFDLKKSGTKRLRKITDEPDLSEIFNFNEAVQDANAHGNNVERYARFSTSMNLSEILTVVGSMPPDWTPQDNKEWHSFTGILSALALPLERVYGFPVKETLSLTKGKWSDFNKTLANAADFDPTTFGKRQMAVTVLDSTYMVQQFRDTVLLPLILNTIEDTGHKRHGEIKPEMLAQATSVAAKALTFGSKNIPASLFSAVRDYIGERIRISSKLNEYDLFRRSEDMVSKYGTDAWPRLVMKDYKASNGLTITNLSKTPELETEGNIMGHCVGTHRYGYAGNARRGRCHIFSVRDDQNNPLGTFEVHGKPPGAKLETWCQNFSIEQFQGPGNSTPPQGARAAYDEFLKSIKYGKVDFNLEELNEFQVSVVAVEEHLAQKLNNKWMTFLGFDYQNKESVKEFWDVWKEVLPRQLAKEDHPGVLFRVEGAKELVAEICPPAAKILQKQAQERAEKKHQKEPENTHESIEP